MVNGLVHIDTIVNKITRDLGLKTQIPYEDFIDWSAEALRTIDAYGMFDLKEDIILIRDYKGNLPCEFYKGFKEYYYWKAPQEIKQEFLEYWFLTLPSVEEKLSYFNTKHLNYNPTLTGNINLNSQTKKDYRIEHRTVYTSFECGMIRVKFLAIPLSEDGFPLIPDDISISTALFWYNASMLSMQGLLKNPEFTYEYCWRKFERFCANARATLNIPNNNQTEQISRDLNSLVPSSLYYNGNI